MLVICTGDEPSPVDLTVAPKTSILVGTLFNNGQCHVPYLLSMLRLAESGIPYELFAVENESFLPRGRAVIAHHFWKGPHTHLLFVDADMGFRIQDLRAMLASGHDVVAGVGPQKSINWDEIYDACKHGPDADTRRIQRAGSKIVVNFKAGASLETDEHGCLEVLDAGTGFMLIKRQVVEKLRVGRDRESSALCFKGRDAMSGELIADIFSPFIESGRYLTEDFAFCRRWQELGGKVHVYIHADLEHVGNYTYRGNLLDHADVIPALP